MKYISASILAFCMSFRGDAQNLISNANFATRTGCPNTWSMVDSSIGWHNGTAGTTDYFNACDLSTYPITSIPQNVFGYQNSSSGAYMGLHAYAPHNDFKEYLTTSFAPLTPGETYSVTVVVSLADSSYYGLKGLGVYFATSTISSPTTGVLTATPQIDYSSYGVVTDKINWVRLTGTFVATQPYNNLVIGSFKYYTDAEVTVAPDTSSGIYLPYNTAYYYIDSVAVEHVIPTEVAQPSTNRPTRLSPNPFSEYAVISFTGDMSPSYRLQVYDATGHKVHESETTNSSFITINRNQLEPGFYYYRLFSQFALLGTDKFTISDK